MRFAWLTLLVCIGSCLAGESEYPPLAATKLSAKAGNPQAQYQLARAYEAEFDLIAAAEWYWAAAVQGMANAQYRLGRILIRDTILMVDGKNTTPTRDATIAAKWFFAAANQGHQEAQVALGRCFAQGDGVVQDSIEAYKWFSIAVKLGNKTASAERAKLIYKMTAEEIQLAQSRADGYLQDAATEAAPAGAAAPVQAQPIPAPGAAAPAESQPAPVPETAPPAAPQPAPAPEVNPPATSQPPAAPQAEAPAPSQPAAVPESEAQTQYKRARAREASANLAGAAELYWAAGKAGLADAQYRLGQILIRDTAAGAAGNSTLPERDPAVAAKWFLKAANQGHALAQLALGNCYLKGEGVAQDYVEAYKWFSLAANQSNEAAIAARDELVLAMTTKQIAQSRQRIEKFKPVRTAAQESAEAAPPAE